MELSMTSDALKAVQRIEALLNKLYPNPTEDDFSNVYVALSCVMAKMMSDCSEKQIDEVVKFFRDSVKTAQKLGL